MNARRMTVVAACLIATAACDKTPEPTAAPASSAKKPASTTTAAAKKPAGATPAAAAKPRSMTWQKPDAWKVGVNKSSMRKATFVVPKAEGDPADAEMSVMQVGGSIPANITRWEGQFEGSPKAKTEKLTVKGLGVTVVQLEGTFKGGGPMMGGGGPQKDYAMLAAIVDTSGGAHFFKMWGPKKTVKGARNDFDKLVGSFAPAK